MKPFEELLASSAEAHGHLCPGQVVGVRMAMLGCRLIGLDDPTSHDQIKKLIVYVEMDRCTGDAVAHVSGAKLGRRSLKVCGLRYHGRYLLEPGDRKGLPGDFHRGSKGSRSSLCSGNRREIPTAARSLQKNAGQLYFSGCKKWRFHAQRI